MEDEIDLFEHVDTLPLEVQAVIEKHQEDWDNGYTQCRAFLDEIEPLGYTFEYGLDGDPYNLKKI